LFVWLGLSHECNDVLCGFHESYKRFGAKILRLFNLHVALITLNAFVSTLGGGFFLCRRIDEAEDMATKQHHIALQLGDLSLASQCRIHLVYNCMQRGQLKRAKNGLLFEWRLAHILEDGHLKSVIRSAWIYLHKLKSIRNDLSRGNVSSKTLTRHQFARQMFVKSENEVT